MENNFKGTIGKANVISKHLHYLILTNENVLIGELDESDKRYACPTPNAVKVHAQNFADAHNVRQQISCDLPELLERFKAMESGFNGSDFNLIYQLLQNSRVYAVELLLKTDEDTQDEHDMIQEINQIDSTLNNLMLFEKALQTKTVVE